MNMAEEKNTKKGGDRMSKILYGFYVLCLLSFFVIAARIIGIMAGYEPDNRIARFFRPNSRREVLVPTRGRIFDRNGRLLAASTPMYQVTMDCTVLKDRFAAETKDGKGKKDEAEWREKARRLSEGLSRIFKDKTADEYYRQIIRNREEGKMYMKVGHQINYDTLQMIKALPLFNEGQFKGGMRVEAKDTRQYPYGSLARRTIGYVKDNSNSNGNNHIGLEGRYDYVLHGTEGVEYLRLTDNRQTIRDYDSTYTPAKDGDDIRTTLDIDIQDIADNAIRSVVKDNYKKVEGATCVVMDVETGAIRAMVNLSRNAADTSDHELYEQFNYAISTSGEPGSVFKTTTLMSLLEDGKIGLHDSIPTNHGHVPGFSDDAHIWDYERENHTNRISVLHGYEISSNYVFRYLAYRYYGERPKKMIEKLYNYKLGEKYDFDLEGFSSPKIPSPESPSWSGTDLGSVAIGYAVQVTPLHLVTFYNAIANKGRMMKPYLVETVEKDGKVVSKKGPSVLNGQICSRATADTLTKAMMRVTEEGTGKRMLGSSLCTVAGKTGTARIAQGGSGYSDKQGRIQYQGTFVGFFPAEAPKYTCIVTMYSRPGTGILYGGTMPAMAFRKIVDGIIAMDSSNGKVIHRSSAMPSMTAGTAKPAQKGIIRDVRGLGVMDAVYLLENEGYKVTYRGTGHVKIQSPQAGSKAAPGTTVTLTLE